MASDMTSEKHLLSILNRATSFSATAPVIERSSDNVKFHKWCQVQVFGHDSLLSEKFHPMRCISSCSMFSPSVTLPWAHSPIDILLSSCRAVISVKPDQKGGEDDLN